MNNKEQDMDQIALELSKELEKLIDKFKEKLNPIQVVFSGVSVFAMIGYACAPSFEECDEVIHEALDLAKVYVIEKRKKNESN